jgi:hypothetical protein
LVIEVRLLDLPQVEVWYGEFLIDLYFEVTVAPVPGVLKGFLIKPHRLLEALSRLSTLPQVDEAFDAQDLDLSEITDGVQLSEEVQCSVVISEHHEETSQEVHHVREKGDIPTLDAPAKVFQELWVDLNNVIYNAT